MKTKMSAFGVMAVFLLLCLPACTRKTTDKPILVAPDKPVIVTKKEYVQLPDQLMVPIERAFGFSSVWSNGDMYRALTHDSRWLDTCKANMDQIAKLYLEAKQRSQGSAPERPGRP